jgi:D-alanyl-D-alanine carboxypeptidase
VAVLVLAVLALIVISLIDTGSFQHHRQTAAVTPPARIVRPKPHDPTSTYARLADSVQVDPKLKLGLRAGLLFDVNSGRVLWERDPVRRLPIASLTKMMTALVVATHSSPHAKVLISRQATDFSGSGVGKLPRGKRVPELPLLYGLLLPSGNDAAMALAQHVGGTADGFVRLMNAQAAHMGLTCTHYSNVSGIVDRGNYSCPRDLAVLAHAVLRQPVLRRVVGTRAAILPFPIKGGKLYLYNNNPLLMAAYPGADGVKTGFTDEAGLCLVATARRNGRWLGVVLLRSGNWLTQAETLLDAGFTAMRRAGA